MYNKKGVLITGNIPNLDTRSYLEPPVVIQASMAPNTLIRVGAFTGIYGGKIAHTIVGRYCSIAPGVDVASDQHPIDWLSSSMIQYVPNLHGWGDWLTAQGHEYIEPKTRFSSNATVYIGNDVWIGQGVFIKSGVSIGDGAVIASHSVVNKSVPPYAIVAGVPAQIKKFRFPDEVIERFLKISWWNYNISSIRDLNFTDPLSSLDKLEELSLSGELVPYKTHLLSFPLS